MWVRTADGESSILYHVLTGHDTKLKLTCDSVWTKHRIHRKWREMCVHTADGETGLLYHVLPRQSVDVVRARCCCLLPSLTHVHQNGRADLDVETNQQCENLRSADQDVENQNEN